MLARHEPRKHGILVRKQQAFDGPPAAGSYRPHNRWHDSRMERMRYGFRVDRHRRGTVGEKGGIVLGEDRRHKAGYLQIHPVERTEEAPL